MALCPFADKRWLIPPGSSDPRISARVAILHTDGGNAENLGPYFDGPSGGIESHFHITKAGYLYQYRDTAFEADANYLANPFAVSIETQGTGYDEWTPEQIVTILRLLRWLNEVHPAILLRKVDRWDGSGIGYHIQFGSPGKWTNVGKICPGPKRIDQYANVILPALASGETGEDDMPTPAELWNYRFGKDKDSPSARATLSRAFSNARDARIAAAEGRGFAKRAEAVSVANGQKLDMLLNRTLTDEQREAAIKQIADDLAEQLAHIDVVVTAEIRSAQEEE